MADETPADHVARLVDELRTLPAETGWLEFKEDLEDPDKIGEYVSALSNGAALDDKPCGYVVWEVNDATHEVTGTGFRPDRKKKGNEDLVPWLARMTEPQLDLRFDRGDLRGKHVVVLRIPRAIGRPTRFWGKEFVRVGSATKSLAEYPETERALWRIIDATPFESRVAMEHVDGARVVELLDHAAYFKLTARPQPADRAGTLDSLSEAGLIRPDGAGRWDVMNLGAILFAHDLGAFGRLGFKALRVIHYQGRGRTAPAREYPAPKGYAAGFDEVIRTLDAILPRNEVIGPAFRTDVRMYPEAAVRELLANALIHQDLSQAGNCPMVEVFENRLEISNPGQPLIPTQRFLETLPKSRNEGMAFLMRLARLCEQRGMGFDRVVEETEKHQLPAPVLEVAEGGTRVVLSAHKPLPEMNRAERGQACFWHASLLHSRLESMTNTTMRARFGLGDDGITKVSVIIREALADGFIRPEDPDQGRRHAKYLPHWP